MDSEQFDFGKDVIASSPEKDSLDLNNEERKTEESFEQHQPQNCSFSDEKNQSHQGKATTP